MKCGKHSQLSLTQAQSLESYLEAQSYMFWVPRLLSDHYQKYKSGLLVLVGEVSFEIPTRINDSIVGIQNILAKWKAPDLDSSA
jgi:hypothetical protein